MKKSIIFAIVMAAILNFETDFKNTKASTFLDKILKID